MHVQALQAGLLSPPLLKARKPLLSSTANAAAVGRHFGRSREWGRQLLKQWYAEQQEDGLPRVVKRGKFLYTSVAVLYHYHPKKDPETERRIRSLESDLSHAFSRIAELERRIGRRR